ncbi:hypothetical protein M378DRAFT_6788 [Amanita muscaria Koide BX008]|uniref:Uncharacterized protein n=1 Tax=Amanita muscaria (strain Koide BX008) TaxID=946122 RepID=A0A0C2X956_AMAMK|nr:hypothetical protein M378DRAFT_6788 [Amanita muscaria Koide BX008]
MALIPLALLWLAHAFLLVCGFDFSVSQVGQCDPFTLLWSGGHPPFQLLIIPPGGVMKNISIPASAYNSSSKQGSYTVPRLDLAQEQLFMLSISDSTGMFAGGTSSLMTVGAPRSGQSCNTTFPRPDFTFSLDSDLAQCSPLVITLYPGPVEPALPIQLLVNIPEGQSFFVNLSPGLSQWTANLTAGTPAALTVLDALGRNGGTETLRVAQPTNDTSCIMSSTPSTGSNSDAQRQKIIGLAVGISVGGFGVLCLALSFFLWYRRKLHNDAMRPTKFLATGPSDVRPQYRTLNPTQSSIVSSKAHLMQGTIRRESFGESSRHRPHPSESSTRPIQSRGSTSVPTPTASYPSDIVTHLDISQLTGPVEFPPEYSPNFPPLSSSLLRGADGPV